MKFFIAALIATLAAADGHDWTEKAECATYLDSKARWLAVFVDQGITPDNDDWDSVTQENYNAQIQALKDAPAGELSTELRASATQLLESVDWQKGNNDIVLSAEAGWPTYPGDDYDADCVKPTVATVTATLGLTNSNSIIEAVDLEGADGSGITATIVTGWKKLGGGEDAFVGYQLAVDLTSTLSWNNQAGNSVALIFGNDDTVTNLEYNEFQFLVFPSNGQIRMNYNKQNLDAKNLSQVVEEGYEELTDEKKYTVTWTEGRGNWSAGSLGLLDYGANVATAGFWTIDRANTKLLSGQAAADNTQILLTVQKENLGDVTTGIKAGGKIHGVICYKKDNTETACDAKSGITEFAWAAESTDADGNTDEEGEGGAGDNDENKDSAVSMAAYGATVLAAISALAF